MSKSREELEYRRQLLIMQARIERMELQAHGMELREQLSWFKTLQRAVGFGGSRSLAALGPFAEPARASLKAVFSKNAWAGLGASLALMKLNPPLNGRTVRGLGAALVLASAVLLWRAQGQKRQGR